jgi:hypothetical protein
MRSEARGYTRLVLPAPTLTQQPPEHDPSTSKVRTIDMHWANLPCTHHALSCTQRIGHPLTMMLKAPQGKDAITRAAMRFCTLCTSGRSSMSMRPSAHWIESRAQRPHGHTTNPKVVWSLNLQPCSTCSTDVCEVWVQCRITHACPKRSPTAGDDRMCARFEISREKTNSADSCVLVATGGAACARNGLHGQ